MKRVRRGREVEFDSDSVPRVASQFHQLTRCDVLHVKVAAWALWDSGVKCNAYTMPRSPF